jgi:type II secretory pathway component PulM
MKILALIFVLLCSPAFAQIKLYEQRTATYIGFLNARVDDSGRVIADASSKPTLASTQSSIVVEQSKPYKWLTVEAEKFPTLEIVVELESVDASNWKFPDSTQPGRYRVTATAFDPELGPAKKRITVDVGSVPPQPDDPPKPDIPPVTDLTGLSLESRKALAAYTQAMAADMKTLAADTRAGKVKTVSEASAANNLADLASRIAFKKTMAKWMEPRLGSSDLRPDAAQVFEEIALGFGSLK